MNPYLIFILLFTSVFTFGQNVGININTPSERLHIQDNSTTKLLLKTSSGTSFFSADSPSNSGLLFRTSGLDKAFIFYSPFSNTLTASIGANGWTMLSNGDFRVKERIYALNDLRFDATESITIEANGALIKIDPDGNIQIEGKSITITAEDDLDISANNININAQNTLKLNSVAATELTSNNLSVTTNQGVLFSLGTDFSLDATNYTLNVANNYNLGIMQNYDLSANIITSQALTNMNLHGTLIKFNGGTTPFARVGDLISTTQIVSGSPNVLGN